MRFWTEECYDNLNILCRINKNAKSDKYFEQINSPTKKTYQY
jgi:hypothetical protein